MKLGHSTFAVSKWERKWKASGCLALLVCTSMSVAILQDPTTTQKKKATPQIANFMDIAETAGLTWTTVFGGVDTKKYILETTGTGVAIFDYDNDGWPDIFVVN